MKIECCYHLRRLLAHILPRRSAMERRSGWSVERQGEFEFVVPMHGPVAMNKRRAR